MYLHLKGGKRSILETLITGQQLLFPEVCCDERTVPAVVNLGGCSHNFSFRGQHWHVHNDIHYIWLQAVQKLSSQPMANSSLSLPVIWAHAPPVIVPLSQLPFYSIAQSLSKDSVFWDRIVFLYNSKVMCPLTTFSFLTSKKNFSQSESFLLGLSNFSQSLKSGLQERNMQLGVIQVVDYQEDWK